MPISKEKANLKRAPPLFLHRVHREKELLSDLLSEFSIRSSSAELKSHPWGFGWSGERPFKARE